MTSPTHCCGQHGFYCDILSQCLFQGDTCSLPNATPIAFTTLIHVESILNFDPDISGDGHVISELLSNNSNSPVVDSQGEEVSIAVIEISDLLPSFGEWQFSTCAMNGNQSSLRGGAECELGEWEPMEMVSEDHALLLPSVARLRFVRRAVELEGAVWMRVKLWDGNEDGYLSPTTDAVRYSQPHYSNTLPFSATGPFSENSTLLTALLFPVIPRPSLSLSPPTLSPLKEDTPITSNPGDTVEELVVRVLIPDLPVLPENVIRGFPHTLFLAEFEHLEPLEVKEYLTRVKEVNPTRLQRQSIMERGLAPSVGIRLSIDDDEVKGRWQVSWNGDVRQFVYVTSLLSSTNQILLLNTSARIRFVPVPDYCGQVSIPFQAWDGYWNETEINQSERGFLVALDTSLSQYNVNQVVLATLAVECVPDKPVFLVNRVQLEPVPYYISYNYEQLLTLIVSMETGVLRDERDRLSELLHVTLEQEINILRIASASTERYVYIHTTASQYVLDK